jgi:GT2 family glycosyltransferase
MKSDCVVSIVIVSWNTRDLLRQCLASTITACEHLGGPAEIILIDNASSDGSVQMVTDEFPQVHVIANDSNRGFAAATNQGIRISRGNYVLLLNPDTTAAADSLGILISFLDSNASTGAAGPRLVGRHGEDQVTCFPLPTLGRELWRLFHLDRVRGLASYPLSRFRSSNPQSVESIQGACMLIRREALEQSGLLDERLFIYTEEIDLCRRFLDLDWRIFWVPAAVIVHYGGESTRQVSARMFLELYRSKIEYFRKHLGARGAVAYKAILFAAALPRIVLTPLLVPFIPSRREGLRALRKNYSSLVLQLPAL